jgi:hypothetical protein
MYAAFSQREIEITLMDARAGSPPTALEFLRRTPPAGNNAQCIELLRQWERWAAQLLETHISYPQLAYYRSQHRNQSWLGSLTTILDSASLLLAHPDAKAASQAHLTFAMARHALVDITQSYVRRPLSQVRERLTAEDLRSMRTHLAGASITLPESPEFAERLAELRLLYEPYAQALAAYLLFELPPWVHAQPLRDNWQGGPWDKLLSTRTGSAHRSDEHF